jgi:hypothetical protein
MTKRLIITEQARQEFWDNILLDLPAGACPRDPTPERTLVHVLKCSHRAAVIIECPTTAIYEAPQLGVRAYIDERNPEFDLVLMFVKIPRCTVHDVSNMKMVHAAELGLHAQKVIDAGNHMLAEIEARRRKA